MKIVKVSTAKPDGKPPTRDKTYGFETDISLYGIKDSGNTEEGEKS